MTYASRIGMGLWRPIGNTQQLTGKTMRTRVLALVLSSGISLTLLVIVLHSVAPSLSNSPPRSANPYAAPLTAQAVSVGGHAPIAIDEPLEPPRTFTRASGPIEVSENEFDRQVARGLVLVKFGAEWCGPCRRVDSELQQLAADNAGSLTVLIVDIDKEKRLSSRHNIGSIPHMILFRDGRQIDQWTGYQSATGLQQGVNQAKPPKGKVQANPFTS